jgi:hypothetical protein
VSEVDAAAAACRELEETAAVFDTEVLNAIAAHARGALELARGDARAALAPLRRSLEAWQRVGAPYLAARLRVLVSRACRALDDSEGADLELDAARAVFEELRGVPDLARIDASAERAAAGRYFVGLHFLYAFTSTMVHGVGRDAEHVVEIVASRTARARASRTERSAEVVAATI